jgi:hypothetical protein
MTATLICDAAVLLGEVRNLVLEELDAMIFTVDEDDVGPAPGNLKIELAIIDANGRHCRIRTEGRRGIHIDCRCRPG